MDFDIIIIGGGASGLTAAVTAKRAGGEGLRVAVLERLDRVGKKLLTTGNGRCNLTNRYLELSRFHGEDSAFAASAFRQFPLANTLDFFAELGVVVKFERDKAYPYSLQASSVVDALRFEAAELGVSLLCGQTVTAIERLDRGFLVKAGGSFTARKVILAAGGSAAPKLGTDGSGFELLKTLGHTIVPPKPAIVQVKTETGYVRQLKGVKVDAVASVRVDGKIIRTENGEVLFCEYGLSGPPILQLSRLVSVYEGDYPMEIVLNFMPEYSFEAVAAMCWRRVKRHPNRTLDEFFTGMLQKRLGQILVKSCGFSLSGAAGSLTPKDCNALAAAVNGFSLVTTGTTGFENAQVTAGGALTLEFHPDTLESYKVPGIYAAGEVLDIDGDCGGFNLQWAWSSGFAAGMAAAAAGVRP